MSVFAWITDLTLKLNVSLIRAPGVFSCGVAVKGTSSTSMKPAKAPSFVPVCSIPRPMKGYGTWEELRISPSTSRTGRTVYVRKNQNLSGNATGGRAALTLKRMLEPFAMPASFSSTMK